jgi:hypothetical protein
MTLMPATLARLTMFALLPLLIGAGGGTPPNAIIKNDHENYTQGPFLAYAAPWSTTTLKTLRRNTDFSDQIVIDPARFPANTGMRWRWPKAPAPTGVYGYNHVSYGNYNNGVPERAVTPLRIGGLKALSTGYAYRQAKTDGDFNVLAELFVTTLPGKADNKVLEIGFFPRMSASGARYFTTARQLGRWKDPQGVTWQVGIAKTYAMFQPVNGERKAGVIDFKAALDWLVARHELSGREWVNGVAIGVEPIMGGGSLTLDRWDVRFR